MERPCRHPGPPVLHAETGPLPPSPPHPFVTTPFSIRGGVPPRRGGPHGGPPSGPAGRPSLPRICGLRQIMRPNTERGGRGSQPLRKAGFLWQGHWPADAPAVRPGRLSLSEMPGCLNSRKAVCSRPARLIFLPPERSAGLHLPRRVDCDPRPPRKTDPPNRLRLRRRHLSPDPGRQR